MIGIYPRGATPIMSQKKRVKAFRSDLRNSAKKEMLEQPVDYLFMLAEYDDAGRVVSKKTYDEGGDLIDQNDFTYDPQGRLLREEYRDCIEDVCEHKEVEHDAANGTMTVKNYFTDGSFYQDVTTYKNREKGLPARIEHFEDGDEPVQVENFEYDERDNLVVHTEQYPAEDRTAKKLYEYDAAGLLVRERHYEEEVLVDDIACTYTAAGLLETKTYQNEEYLEVVESYRYDDKANLINETTKVGGEVYRVIDYAYDDRKNCTGVTYQDRHAGQGVQIVREFNEENEVVVEKREGTDGEKYRIRFEYE